jgi:hypothetical protein
MGEVNGVRKYDRASGFVNNEYLVLIFEQSFSGIYYCDPDYLSTFCSLDFLNDRDISSRHVNELLPRDEMDMQKKSSFSQRNFGSKKYSDPLFFSFVKESQRVDRYYERFNRFVALSVTNLQHLEGHIRGKSGASLGESSFILYPFRDLKAKFIELSFQPPHTLIMIRGNDAKEFESEWLDFLFHFQRYIKCTSDADIVSIENFVEEDFEHWKANYE